MRGTRLLLGWLLLALALRLGIIWLAGDIPLVGDEIDYQTLAVQLGQGQGFGYGQGAAFVPTSYRAPGWPALLAGLYRLVGVQVMAARLLQAVIMTGVVALTFLLGKALFGWRAGILAAALVALDPLLLAFSTWLWAEPLYLLLALAALWLLVGQAQRPAAGLGRLGAAGILWGAATLTRESGLVLALFILLWLAWLGWRRGGARLVAWPAAFLLPCLLVLAPWTARNLRVQGRFIPITSVSGLTLWLGNNPWGAWQPVFERYFQPDTEMAREELARREALAYIKESQPLWLPRKVAQNWPALLGPENFLLSRLRQGGYGPVSPGVYAAAYAGTLLFYVLVGSAGILGLWLATNRPDRLLLLAPVIALLLTHTLLHAHSRHRLPLLPILALFAAWSWQQRRFVWSSLCRWPPRPRQVGAVASLALFLLLNIPFKREIAARLFGLR